MVDHSHFDKRKYPVVDVQQGYGEWSQTYDKTVLNEMDLRLFNRVDLDWGAQETILDLACGTGRIGAWLRQRTDAIIDGIDLTADMLVRARERGIYHNLSQGDITHTGLAPAQYDLCTQSLADEHLPDLTPLYTEVARLTKPDGHFVLVGFHPYFLLAGIPTHFDNADGNPISIQSYVHLLSDHVKIAHATGWSLVALDEGVIDDDWIARKPKWQKYYGLPVSFSFVWQRNH